MSIRRAGPATSPRTRDGFGGTATGGARTYGNNLANYFINNSGRLGVLYVIWFRRIWLPSSGWKSYSGLAVIRPATTRTTCTCRSAERVEYGAYFRM